MKTRSITTSERSALIASANVERVLREIAQLSDDEQGEILNGLPTVLHRATEFSQLALGAVRQAVATRERIRRRLAEASVSADSITTNVDGVREGWLVDI
jgi:hypothetical protein